MVLPVPERSAEDPPRVQVIAAPSFPGISRSDKAGAIARDDGAHVVQENPDDPSLVRFPEDRLDDPSHLGLGAELLAQVVRHGVERPGELLELVPASDLDAAVEISPADAAGPLPQDGEGGDASADLDEREQPARQDDDGDGQEQDPDELIRRGERFRAGPGDHHGPGVGMEVRFQEDHGVEDEKGIGPVSPFEVAKVLLVPLPHDAFDQPGRRRAGPEEGIPAGGKDEDLRSGRDRIQDPVPDVFQIHLHRHQFPVGRRFRNGAGDESPKRSIGSAFEIEQPLARGEVGEILVIERRRRAGPAVQRFRSGAIPDAGSPEDERVLGQPFLPRRGRLARDKGGEEFRPLFEEAETDVDRHGDLAGLEAQPVNRFFPDFRLHMPKRQISEQDHGRQDAQEEDRDHPPPERGSMGKQFQRLLSYFSFFSSVSATVFTAYEDTFPMKAPSLAQTMSSWLGPPVSGFTLLPSGPMLYRSK